jgi:hypothetical protein
LAAQGKKKAGLEEGDEIIWVVVVEDREAEAGAGAVAAHKTNPKCAPGMLTLSKIQENAVEFRTHGRNLGCFITKK